MDNSNYNLLINHIYNTNNWFTIDELNNEFDLNKKELKKILEKLKDIDLIVQAGSRYLLKKHLKRIQR